MSHSWRSETCPHQWTGLPIAVALTGGEVSDFKGYMNADGLAPKVLLANKGYWMHQFVHAS
jgi:hypothetical protein